MFWADFPEIRRELDRVQDTILNEVSKPGGVLSEALRGLATRDAKLLRPAFTILAARIQTGGAPVHDRVIRLAAAIEMLHMASLIHDDIVDDATKRRGHPAIHVTYGSRRAVLMGDFLFSRCMALVADLASGENARTVSSAVAQLISAEIAETEGGRTLDLSVRRYLHRVIGKTAVLFALSFHLGASEAAAEVDNVLVQILRRIGYNIGVGFQIMDDLLDLTGNVAKTGKSIGTDLMQGVITLPVIAVLDEILRDYKGLGRVTESALPPVVTRRFGLIGMRHANLRLARSILRLRGKRAVRPHTMRAVQTAIERAGGVRVAQEYAERYTARAGREIERLPAGTDTEILRIVTDRLLARAW